MIGFAGMTHLGLVSGICAAEKGERVLCFDPDPLRRQALSRGESGISEPGLSELLRKNAAQVAFTDAAGDLASCNLIYVAADVPTDDAGASDLRPIEALLESVLAVARPEATVVVLSQVPPGFTRGKGRPGRSLFYQVETLVFGRAVERALAPERYIVGCANPSQDLPAAYASFLERYACPVLRMRYESAELAKIAINMFLASTVATANTLAELCESLGADWSEIVPALKLDRRIGPYAYLGAGLGIGGGNLERDLRTVCGLALRHGTDAGVVGAWMENSRHRRGWAAQKVKSELLGEKPDALVAIWGLAYKENTSSVLNSPSLATIAQLPEARLALHDPVVAASAVTHPRARGARDAMEAVDGADALLILTPWPQYREVRPAEIARAMRGRLVVDPYQVLDPRAAESAGLRVLTLGRPC